MLQRAIVARLGVHDSTQVFALIDRSQFETVERFSMLLVGVITAIIAGRNFTFNLENSFWQSHHIRKKVAGNVFSRDRTCGQASIVPSVSI